jgi:hypothetical protein
MQLLFKSRHPQATASHDLTERRVRFVLRRLVWLVPCTEVHLTDVNGPRGSVGKANDGSWPGTAVRHAC